MNSQIAEALMLAAQDPRVQKAARQGVQAAGRGLQKFASRSRAPRAPRQRSSQAPFNRRMVQRAPVALSRQMGPRGGNASNTRVTRGREFIGDVAGSSSSTPAIVTYVLNPGFAASFPRLSQEANVWEQYHFRKLKAIYTPAVSTATSGTVIITPEYNANQAPPVSEAGLLNHQGSKSGSPWADMEVILSAANMHGNAFRKYVREGMVIGDLNSYDAGQLHVAAVSNGGTGVMGKLWLEYEVEFYIPQVDPVSAIPRTLSLFTKETITDCTTTVETPISFGTEVCNALHITTADNLYFVPPKGVYLVLMYAEAGTTLAATSLTVQAYINKNDSHVAFSTLIYEPSIAGQNRDAFFVYGFVSCDGSDQISGAVELTAAGGGGDLSIKTGHTGKLLFMNV
jgi:hypothetical protein